jgi:Stage II sporulation protein E (SpoIIE)
VWRATRAEAVSVHQLAATCLYAVHDPASRRCTLTSAGHLPPTLCHPGGTVEFLDVAAGVMLGAGPGDYLAADIDLPPGSVLALYTDGLVEQPGQDISAGMSRLASALAAGPPRWPDQRAGQPRPPPAGRHRPAARPYHRPHSPLTHKGDGRW